jgi:hypothetical protein
VLDDAELVAAALDGAGDLRFKAGEAIDQRGNSTGYAPRIAKGA